MMVLMLASEFIAQSLLHRRDVAPRLRQQIDLLSTSAPLYRLILRHAPDVVTDQTSASAMADLVLPWRQAFKRCKEYLLAYQASRLSDAQCERLVEQLDLIPEGIDTDAEARIRKTLARLEGPRGRFSLIDPDYVLSTRKTDENTITDIATHARRLAAIREGRIGMTYAERLWVNHQALPLDYVWHVIVKTACDTTGDDADDIDRTGRIDIPPRDAVEFLIRLQATFDCVFRPLRYEALSVEVNELAAQVMAAQQG